MRGLPDEQQRPRRWGVAAFGLVVVLALFFGSPIYQGFKIWNTPLDAPDICVLHDKVVPSSYEHDKKILKDIIHSEKFRKHAVDKLAKSVKVDTVVIDEQPPPRDAPKVWAKFKKFHEYLEESFPDVYDKVEVEYVNTYGLVYTWKGTDKNLKPFLLMAHQDTVPVQEATLDKWTHPPLSGHYDGKFVYGRGALDCKNQLVAIMQTLDILAKSDFVPKRTIVASFGFDEEAQGLQGASELGKFLKKRYGKNGVYAIVDEGSGLMEDPSIGKVIAAPAIGEKGYMDLHVDLFTIGGHASIPPPHTSIGIMGELQTLIESDTYAANLTTDNPFFYHLECAAVHSTKLPDMLKKMILRARTDEKAMSKVVSSLENTFAGNLMRTVQALTIVNGGEKANALPEHVTLVTNHRVGVDDSLDAVREKFTGRVMKVANDHNITVVAFGKKLREGDGGLFNITSPADLDIAPQTPHTGAAWRLLAGINRHVFEDLGAKPEIDYPLLTVPTLTTGNTDTRYYWGITKNIYRFAGFLYTPEMVKGMHSVDEKVEVDAHLSLIAWFHQYVKAVDEAKD
ncbi:carboxypeptidase S [Diutina catenulata]